jgi:hypothetical protein
MPPASTSPRTHRGSFLAVLLAVAIALAMMASREGRSVTLPECESGILDDGRNGMDVLVYEMCAERLSVGFRNSDVIEEITCRPSGRIELWLSTDDSRCADRHPDDGDHVRELWEPLKDVGRQTAAPVRKLLTCHGRSMYRTTLVVPDARAALLETRTGNSPYEDLTRRFISRCVPPNV